MTLSESAQRMLTEWTPPDDEQHRLRDDFLTHIATHDRPWSRDCVPDHLTASALVVDPSRTRILLALHRKVGLWLQLGGHIEPTDVSIADAALREAQEESGLAAISLQALYPLRLDRHAAPCRADAGHHLDVQFVAVADPSDAAVGSQESLAVQWFAVTKLPSQTDDAVRCLVAAACEQRRG